MRNIDPFHANLQEGMANALSDLPIVLGWLYLRVAGMRITGTLVRAIFDISNRYIVLAIRAEEAEGARPVRQGSIWLFLGF